MREDRDLRRPGSHTGVALTRLDFGWWASNGPTGGYLASLALEAACERAALDPSWARSIDLHVLRLAAADRYQVNVSLVTGPSRIALASVTFSQGEPFATASVYFSPPRGTTQAGDSAPPSALPPEAYAEMSTSGLRVPPVMGQFSYRPTAGPDGRGPKDGWDLVWVRPVHPVAGRAGVARMLDCWYPPNHMRMVRNYLAGIDELADPPAANLLGASVLFPADDERYATANFALLANRLIVVADGHYLEHDRGLV